MNWREMTGNTVWLGLMGLIWAGFMLVFSCTGRSEAFQHLSDLPKPIVQAVERRDIACFLSDEKLASMTLLDGRVVMRRGLMYVLAMYSLDGGEKVNLSFLYPIAEGHVHPFPTVYVFGDIINNPKSIQVYVDQTGDGICKGIVFEPLKEGS